jgi:hypothetical protein
MEDPTISDPFSDGLPGGEYYRCPVCKCLGGVMYNNGGEICESCNGEGKVTWTKYIILRSKIKRYRE